MEKHFNQKIINGIYNFFYNNSVVSRSVCKENKSKSILIFILTLTVRCQIISGACTFSTEAVHHPKPPGTKI